MNELEAQVRCLEVAERLARAQGKTDAESVVEIQTTLYSHITRVTAPSDKPAKAPKPKP